LDNAQWSDTQAYNISKIYLAGLRDPDRSISVQQKLLNPEHPEVQMQWDRVADVYVNAFSQIGKHPQEVRAKLIGSATWLPYETMGTNNALKILGSLVSACGQDEAPVIPYRFDPLQTLDYTSLEIAMDAENTEYLGNVVRAHPYYSTGKTLQNVTQEINAWAASDFGGKAVMMEYGDQQVFYADEFLPGVIQALEPFPEEQRVFTQRLIDDDVSLNAVMGYVAQNIEQGSDKANGLYRLIQDQRPDQIIATTGLQRQRSTFAVEQGDPDVAVENARTLPYTEYCRLMLKVAERKHRDGDNDAARSIVDTIYRLDPAEFTAVADGSTRTTDRDRLMRRYLKDTFIPTAIEVGTIDLAVAVYNEDLEYSHSLQTGDTSRFDQTSANMFGYDIADKDRAPELLRHLQADEDIPFETKMRLSIGTLRAVNEKWALEENKRDDLQTLYTLAEPLITEALVVEDSSAKELTAALLVQVGRGDEGLRLSQAPKDGLTMDELTADAVIIMAYSKNSRAAFDLFIEHNGANMSDEFSSKAQGAILEASILRGDFATSRDLIDTMFPRDIHSRLSLFYGKHRDKEINVVPGWLLETMIEESRVDAITDPGEYVNNLAWFLG
jgi:hypothetical protein